MAKQEAAGTTYYRYNTENLMTRIDFAGGGNSYYDYDADSKRVSQRTPDGHRAFVYQGPDMLKLQLERDESEETVAHYTMGAGLEAMRRDSASSFYHYNHLGTALALTGADEAVTDTYRHDAWGVLLAGTGSTVNPHTYVGRERYYRMPNAGMYHLGFRDYAQGVGRFATVDPILKTAKPYGYTSNRPLVMLDPDGRLPALCTVELVETEIDFEVYDFVSQAKLAWHYMYDSEIIDTCPACCPGHLHYIAGWVRGYECSGELPGFPGGWCKISGMPGLDETPWFPKVLPFPAGWIGDWDGWEGKGRIVFEVAWTNTVKFYYCTRVATSGPGESPRPPRRRRRLREGKE